MNGYDVFNDPYCYKGTFVLKNRARIRDAKTLEAFELEMSTLRSLEPLPDGSFTPAHYQRIHHHLFQDVYTWAGKYRTVQTAKGGNPFAFADHIPASMDLVFEKLALPALRPGSNEADFLDAAADSLPNSMPSILFAKAMDDLSCPSCTLWANARATRLNSSESIARLSCLR